MAEQTIDKTEPTQHEVESAWLAHNAARVDAGPGGISAIEAMRIALLAANAAVLEAHEKHEEFVEECIHCEIASLRGAYAEVTTEYARYRQLIRRNAELKSNDTSGSISPETIRTLSAKLRDRREGTQGLAEEQPDA